MNKYEGLALAADRYSRLNQLCLVEDITTWKPTDAQRAEYVRLGEGVLDAMREFGRSEKRSILETVEVRSVLSARQEESLKGIESQIPSLRVALDALDPGSQYFRELFYGKYQWRGAVRGTFEEGLNQVRELLERNPHLEEGHGFYPDEAEDVLASGLVRFEPDEWLNRLEDLVPVRSVELTFHQPPHMRIRLEEVFRAYTFGLWVSVLGLSRSILEYAILDNASRLRMDTRRPPGRDGKRKDKSLADLCEDVAALAPWLTETMRDIRETGNQYVHPETTRISREALEHTEKNAKRVLPALVKFVGAMYGLRR